MKESQLKILKDFRQELHSNPEISGEETNTAAMVKSFIEIHNSGDVITNLGGNGLAVVYNFPKDGPTIVFRCELDALPIQEECQFSYASKIDGVSHKCGHDGHMAILAGVALALKDREFEKGRLVLLFQPAEEVGMGAEAILKDEKFNRIAPDYMFALHNIPGETMHEIILIEKSFSATVQSIIIKLNGKKSHASEPEKGINPAMAISQLIQNLNSLIQPNDKRDDFTLLTPVCISMGNPDYGISAGYGELHYTVRTWDVESMENLKGAIIKSVDEICKSYKLEYSMEWLDYFPAAKNNHECVGIVQKMVDKLKIKHKFQPSPFKFGEDFGWFSQNYKTAMFGLGAGLDTPPLHNSTYDFPDELIETGVKIFMGIADEILG